MASQRSDFAPDLYDFIESNDFGEDPLIRAASAAEEGFTQPAAPDLLYGSQNMFGVDDAPLSTPAVVIPPPSPTPEPRGGKAKRSPSAAGSGGPPTPAAAAQPASPAPSPAPGLAAMLKMVHSSVAPGNGRRATGSSSPGGGDAADPVALDSDTETCPGSPQPEFPSSASPGGGSPAPRVRSISISSSSSSSSSMDEDDQADGAGASSSSSSSSDDSDSDEGGEEETPRPRHSQNAAKTPSAAGSPGPSSGGDRPAAGAATPKSCRSGAASPGAPAPAPASAPAPSRPGGGLLPPGARILEYLEGVREANLAKTLERPEPPAGMASPPGRSPHRLPKDQRPKSALAGASKRKRANPRPIPQTQTQAPAEEAPQTAVWDLLDMNSSQATGAAAAAASAPAAASCAPGVYQREPLLTPSGDPWPGSDPPPMGRVRYGGTGDSRDGLWDDPEIVLAASRYAEAQAPVPVFVPEMGDSTKQYNALVRMVFESREAMSWLQNSKLSGQDQNLAQFCQKFIHAPRGHGSFITGSVANPLPHIGDAMAAGNALWALPHAAASVAMSRRYDRTQKSFILQSLRRAYADMAYPRDEAGRPDSLAAVAGYPAQAAAAAASQQQPEAPAPSVRVREAYTRVCAALGPRRKAAAAAAAPGTRAPRPSAFRLRELGDACVLACQAVFEALLRLRGGASAVPGLDPSEIPSPACPPEALCSNPAGLETAALSLYELRDLVERARLLGDSDPTHRLGSDELRLAVRAVLVVARTVAPLVRYNAEGARARASAWTVTQAVFSIPSLVGGMLGEAVSLLAPPTRSQQPSSSSPGGEPFSGSAAAEGSLQTLPPLWPTVPGKQSATVPSSHSQSPQHSQSGGGAGATTATCCRATQTNARSRGQQHQPQKARSPQAAASPAHLSQEAMPGSSSDDRAIHGRPRGKSGKRRSEPLEPAAQAGASASFSSSARGYDPSGPVDSPPAPKRRVATPGHQAPRALGPMPAEGPDRRGGFRRVPRGDCHTPRPSDAACAAYCPPELVAELIDNQLFPEAWRPALTFDPQALATIAARCSGPPARDGARFGELAASGPLRRRAAWMHQIPDPEDVKVVVLYSPLQDEDLLGGLPASRPGGSRREPLWSDLKGGLSALLAALGNRILTKRSHAWAGNWTGAPDVSALNAQGVLLLSTGDLAFTGCVEYLCLRLGSARRKLLVLDAVSTEDWPQDGPAISQYHIYMRAALTPRVACAVRWPRERHLSRAVLTSSTLFGPGLFARAEAAFARLYPDSAPLRLCRSSNVAYTVDTRAGERTRVPLAPREYRQRVLPDYDGCKDMRAQAEGLGFHDPDFEEGAAQSHRAANRWGLGAWLRPVYLACGRRGAGAVEPSELLIPELLSEFCRVALLEPDAEAEPLVLPITEAPRRRAPRVDWEPGFGSRSTSVLHMGATELCLPEPDDELEIDGAGDVELVVEHPGPSPGVAQALRRAPIKIEVVSDDEDGGDWCNPYLS
ncbi:transcriptional activator [Equid alphaherpesvirus 1]|uniref:Major viral transcription factor n=5 Tax=Equid alphaherpesvirus 1 TaxID=10326 RepID=ICP4_EHV1B|nr:transcriptional regulator ICP4 [Equid alphaherpesvirus 1]YP_053124.1 transcriptional regulator ICP4 [Equid alphaherpesvirus 1]P28925.1 RecName: Full=Major viral transcription factor; AltName: Full=155 kDa immediate-early protein [Equine herpesvirus type 1 (strain AB4P)]AAT67321.1 transcriptional activator [Equid alphaherpesvirus 1]AAT67337.1 transcriptional activator [Equid alphaherpesvirus 1]QPK41033.1 transcriptional regulator ICP4 [Equid alphaherpesvirus 1]BAX36460.1 transcriptional reg